MTSLELRETRQSIYVMCRVTLRGIIVAMLMIFGIAFLLVSIRNAEAASLKPLATVNDDYIRVSDLFDGAGEAGATVLGNAPQPGSDITLNARTLLRIADAYKLGWKPQSVAETVTIKRDSHAVNPMDIQNAVKDALDKRGVEGAYTVVLNNLNAAMILPTNLPATAEVTNLTYTPGRDVFIATVASPSADHPVKTINVSGTIQKTVKIPTLNATLKKGDLIGTADIAWVDVAAGTLQPDTLTDADTIVGKTPVRYLGLNQPIRARDVMNPQLVARGDEVTIIFHTGGMELTAKGKAMQNGAAGDMVRTINVSSNRSMDAKVTGDRTVTVD